MPKIGDRMRFVGHDHVYHDGEREGKVGTVVLDANLDKGTNFGDGTCVWHPDNQPFDYITSFDNLEPENV